MSADRERAGEDEVSLAISQIRADHRLGKQILKELPERAGYGEGVIDGQAQRLADSSDEELVSLLGTQWNETKVRKARQFADGDHGYTQERLNELCRLLREHRPVFGTSHVGLLITVAWPDREALQRECLEGNWSTSELQAEIKRRYGPRRQGGRRRRVSSDPGRALVQLEEMADTWRRWFEVAYAEEILSTLPRQVRSQVEAVQSAMSLLRRSDEGVGEGPQVGWRSDLCPTPGRNDHTTT